MHCLICVPLGDVWGTVCLITQSRIPTLSVDRKLVWVLVHASVNWFAIGADSDAVKVVFRINAR